MTEQEHTNRTSERPSELVLGYATPLIARPGDTVEMRISTTAQRCAATVVRLVSVGSESGVVTEPVAGLTCPSEVAGAEFPVPAGSSIAVGPSPAFGQLSSFTVAAWVFPTLPTEEPQVLFGTLDGAEMRGWQLLLDRSRGVGVRSVAVDGPTECWSELGLATSSWSHIAVSVDAAASSVRFHRFSAGVEEVAERAATIAQPASGELLVIAAPQHRHRPVTEAGNGCFNGKISAPMVAAGAVARDRMAALRDGASDQLGVDVILDLDLADAIDSPQLRDGSPQGHTAAVINMPTAGVTGPNWRGSSSSFIEARDEYAAVHFHDDDLEDSGWDVAFELEIPAELASGVYAARLETADCVDHVPFFVTDPGRARSQAALMIPTLTYLAYANEHEILSNPPSYTAFTGRESEDAELTWRDWYSVEEGMVSLYDMHRDGSSVCYASTRRPLVNARPDYIWPLLDGPHGLGLDLRLIGWLERSGFEFDLLTDHDLHDAGVTALDPYRVVITGAHPEYWTGRMLDALETYQGDGGRLLYTGGNGLYGVTGIDAERPHVAEVRRALMGSRPSSSAPGELWMTTTSEQGGVWRHRGRGSHRYVGVGTTAMGAGPGRPYRRSEASRQPEFDWVFDGVEGELVGVDGGILGGAASYEFDRADPSLGTPEHAVVLATADGFERLYYPMLEDFMGSNPEVADPGSPLVRADMVMAIDGNGGGAFSAASAAWCGSLVDERDQPTDVATITGNVLRRFIDTPRGSDPLDRTPE